MNSNAALRAPSLLILVLAALLALGGCGGGGGSGSGGDSGDSDAGGGTGGAGGGTGQSSYKILATNDLGMHCVDADFSVFSILPPYNVVNAQVVRTDGTGRPSLLNDS
ncbi:MAG: hypothetical protein MUO39_10090, partial [Steroidobacteraceae bacterium]|nr:hypothetical protein [Steroidobacteraceae bacterium]